MRGRALKLALAALALGVLPVLPVAGAQAGGTQAAIFEDPGVVYSPGPTLDRLRVLGASQVRLFLPWNSVAPAIRSRKRPRNFDAADPAAYPDARWAPWDQAIIQAQARNIAVDLNVSGNAPLWATGPGAPRDKLYLSWMPSPQAYGAFVHAVGERYSGTYDPDTHRLDPGNPRDLPRVSFWSIWNEPNYGPSLAPQGVVGDLSVEHSPAMYRGLLNAAWGQLLATGHAQDTILVGELAPRGYPPVRTNGVPPWGLFSEMKPLRFLRVLYCVGPRYRPLGGRTARLRGCPTTAAGRRQFRQRNPALFDATGVAIHPYSRWYPPNVEPYKDPDIASLADIGQLERTLDHLQRVYGSRRQLPIWNTEYGYITDPPKHSTRRIPYVSPATAAAFLNHAEYISWRNPRIRSFMQYLLRDPLRPTPANAFGGFASGLETWNGHNKPTLDAWRLPLYLPRTRVGRGATLEVWGCARPASFALQDLPSNGESVQVQFARGRGVFTTVRWVPVTNPRGYFDTRVKFPGPGRVRLRWTYPMGDPALPGGQAVLSRTIMLS